AGGTTRRNLILVAGGQVALLAIWFGATTLLARKLGPEALGPDALRVNAIKIFTSCFRDPLDLAVMREAPTYFPTDRPRALARARWRLRDRASSCASRWAGLSSSWQRSRRR